MGAIMNQRFIMSSLMLGFVTLLIGCGGGDGGGGGTPAPGPAPVPAVPTSSLTLQWDAVTATDLAGYKVYQSTNAGSLGTLVKGDIPTSTTTYTVPNLTVGSTYYFVVKSFDTSGNESSASNQVSKLIE